MVELLVVFSLIAVLTAITIPIGKGLLTRSQTIHCSQNQRQIGMAVMMYAADNFQRLPVTSHQRRQGGQSWTLTLQPYASGTITFKCPHDDHKERSYTYLINDMLTPNPSGAPELDYSYLSKIDRPEQTFLFAEASSTYLSADHFHFSGYHGGAVPSVIFSKQVGVESHGGKSNYLFADGHVETLSWKETQVRLKASGTRFVDPSNL